VFADHAQRWGDAPVHSIAAALFAPKSQLHFFKDIGKLLSYLSIWNLIGPFEGYKHAEFGRCPQGKQWREGHCSCDSNNSFGANNTPCLLLVETKGGPDFAINSCLRHFMRLDD
jgi:alpha 1,2-mannosyltransferase